MPGSARLGPGHGHRGRRWLGAAAGGAGRRAESKRHRGGRIGRQDRAPRRVRRRLRGVARRCRGDGGDGYAVRARAFFVGRARRDVLVDHRVDDRAGGRAGRHGPPDRALPGPRHRTSPHLLWLRWGVSPDLSVVGPVYNEEAVLPLLVQRLRPVLDEFGEPYEVLIVDDGSVDATPAVLAGLRRTWPELRVIRLRRNSGHQAALVAG